MAISADEISQDDTIRLVRISMKCADLLTDFDVVDDLYKENKSKYIKHEIKEPFEKLGAEVDRFSSAFLKPFVDADSKIQMEIQKIFRELSDKIFFRKIEMTALFLMYAKSKSIVNDITEMEFKDAPLFHIKTICKEFNDVMESKYKEMLKGTDKNGNGILQVIEGFDNLGKTIMHS